MKIDNSNNLTAAICVALVLFVSTPAVFGQPPDNAALLYYKAFLLYEKPDATMDKMLDDFRSGKIKANEVIEQHIEKNSRVIDFIVAAADTPNCDWGYDYSQGFELAMPNLAQLRRVTYLLEAGAKLLAEQGNYGAALDRCLSMHKMALHAADRTLVSYLVAISISRRADTAIQDILKDTPENSEVLKPLKDGLTHIENKFPLVRDYIVYEAEVCAATMRKDKAQTIVGMAFDGECRDPNTAERILAADEEFFERNRAYYNNSIAAMIAALESGLPYPQTYKKLDELVKKVEQDAADKNPDATLTAMFLPAVDRIYSIAVRANTHSNAVKTAIEICIMKANTGKLPDMLPAGLPGDLFSGKPFEYKKTADGFILRCQGKDLSDKDKKIYEYEFKISK
jgi:hypothetical protein